MCCISCKGREEVVNGVCAVLDVGDTLVPGRSRREDTEVLLHVFILHWGLYKSVVVSML